jgi:peptidoglycan/xylan/chitin deacetylase (PgdA/CDA1 family)
LGSVTHGAGTLALTFDTELIWGSFDTFSPTEFAREFPDIRRAIAASLRLLERYEVPATWAVLGHLYLGECRRDATGRAHADMVHPVQSWFDREWFAADPCTDRATDPLWYGDDIVDAIRAAGPRQEIGCHSFSHALFDDPALTAEAVRSDLEACLAQAARHGITLRSFVFPRNREGFHALLREYGFRAFRGADPTWHSNVPGAAGRLAHLADQAISIPPPVSVPFEQLPGLWNIPGSMLLLHRSGLRRLVPLEARVRKARRGLRRAIRERGVFHLWTHPFNLANDHEGMLKTLEAILRDAVRLRDAGRLRIESMGEIADRMAMASGVAEPSP